jgi:hypothetical protein
VGRPLWYCGQVLRKLWRGGLNQLYSMRRGAYQERTTFILSAHSPSNVKHSVSRNISLPLLLGQSRNKTSQFVFIKKMWAKKGMQNAVFSSVEARSLLTVLEWN